MLAAGESCREGAMITRHRLNTIAGLGFLVVSGAGWLSTASAEPALPALSPELAKLRASLEKYQDPYVAVRDGYFSTVACIDFPRVSGEAGHLPYKAGGMGIHFLNPRLIGPEADPMRPAILLYEPDGGKLRLVGVEWFVPLATGVKQRPAVFGQPFDGPMEGHEPVLPGDLHHYDLHAWLWKENPNGLFSPTNPTVSCEGYDYTVVEKDAPHVVSGPGS